MNCKFLIKKDVTVQLSGFTVTESVHFKVCLRQRGGFLATQVHWLLTAQLQAELLQKDRRYPARYLRCKIMVTVPIRRAPILLVEEERDIDRLTDIDTCASF